MPVSLLTTLTLVKQKHYKLLVGFFFRSLFRRTKLYYFPFWEISGYHHYYSLLVCDAMKLEVYLWTSVGLHTVSHPRTLMFILITSFVHVRGS